MWYAGNVQDSGNLGRVFAKRYPAQALNKLSWCQVRPILAKQICDDPAMQPVR